MGTPTLRATAAILEMMCFMEDGCRGNELERRVQELDGRSAGAEDRRCAERTDEDGRFEAENAMESPSRCAGGRVWRSKFVKEPRHRNEPVVRAETDGDGDENKLGQ